jgi:hypothetical protein
LSWRLGLVFVLAVSAIPFIQGRLDALLGEFRVQDEVLYLWSPTHVKRVAAGFEHLAADIYWLRTVQYFGGQRRQKGEKNFALLKPLIDITTTLDPELEIAYRYGAIFLCEPPPEGAGRCEDGLALLEQGAAALPKDWRLLQQKGFFTFLFLHDSERAARDLRRASQRPGAAYWLEMMAADLLSKGGQLGASRRMWQEIFDTSESGVMRENARMRLRLLDSVATIDQLSGPVSRFQKEHGRFPSSLDELKVGRYWSGPLADAEGVPFRYDPATGRVDISRKSRLWRRDLVGKDRH